MIDRKTPYEITEQLRSLDDVSYQKAVIQWEHSASQIVDSFLAQHSNAPKMQGIELASGVQMFRTEDKEFFFIGQGMEIHCREDELAVHTDTNGKHYFVVKGGGVIHLTDEELALLK